MPGRRSGQHVDNMSSSIICVSHFQRSVRCEEGREIIVLCCRKIFGVDCPEMVDPSDTGFKSSFIENKRAHRAQDAKVMPLQRE